LLLEGDPDVLTQPVGVDRVEPDFLLVRDFVSARYAIRGGTTAARRPFLQDRGETGDPREVFLG